VASEKKEEKKSAEDQLRESAYYKWEQAGRPNGDGSEFWLAAEKEEQDKSKKTEQKK
jgi:hypothetical protein